MRKVVVALHSFVECLRSYAILNMEGLQIVVLQMNSKTALPTALNKVSEKLNKIMVVMIVKISRTTNLCVGKVV